MNLSPAIDAMIPIGRGQRELIIGDRQTGKTTAAVDAILNQTDVLCVYVAVGQKNSTVAEMLSSLATQKDLSTVVVVIAGADEAATLQFLAPYTGATIAEYFMLQGEATCTMSVCFFGDHQHGRLIQAMSSTCMLGCWSEVQSYRTH